MKFFALFPQICDLLPLVRVDRGDVLVSRWRPVVFLHCKFFIAAANFALINVETLKIRTVVHCDVLGLCVHAVCDH